MAYKKPQYPLKNGDNYIYPPTTADQVILSDGSRLEKNGVVEADKLSDKRTITLTGGVTGSVTFDGSSDVTMNTSVLGASSGTIITPGGSEGQILAVNADGTISPNSRTIASLGTGATYSLNGTVLTITTL